jgi:hypothetical protein
VPRLRLWGIVRGDRGAVAALVAILVSSGVLLGMGALVVDVGILWAERTSLVAGADAAAVGVAKACIANNDDCTTGDMRRLADRYASRNSRDGRADAAVCGVLPSGPSWLPSCSGLNPALCQGSRPSGQPFVEVHSISERPGGSTVLPPAFAGSLTGNGATEVRACARVSWGPVLRGVSEPSLMVCQRTFDAMTGGGLVFQSPPPGSSRHASSVGWSDEEVLFWRPGTDGCTAGSTDQFMFIQKHSPGGANCPHQLVVGATENGTITPEIPSGCATPLNSVRSGKRAFPVAVVGPGDTTVGIATFVVTGWRAPRTGWTSGYTSARSSLSGVNRCSLSTSRFCLYGYFTTATFLDEPKGPLGDTNFGAVYLRTIG